MSQAINQVIPEGYKQTEIGIIPEDWNYSELGDFVSSLEAGISVNSVDKIDAFSHGLHILKTSCVSKGYFNPNEIKSVIPSDVYKVKTIPSDGSIIVSRMNTPDLVGELGFVDGNYPNLFLPDRLWQMRFRSNVRTNTRWLAYILTYPATSKKIKESATGTSNSMKNISKGSLLSVSFPSPAYEEQTAIANALSDMDALLSELENLIAKKQAMKNATMQQLLTGKTRLPQFAFYSDINSTEGAVEGMRNNASATNVNVGASDDSSLASQESGGMGSRRKSTKASELGEIPEDWDIKNLGYLLEDNRIPSGLYKDKNLYGAGTAIIKLGDVFKNDSFNPDIVQRVKTTNIEDKAYSVKIGDLVIALASVKLEGVGKVMMVNELSEPTVYDHNVALIRFKENYNSNFMSFLFKSNYIRSLVASRATQVGTTFLKTSTILAFPILLPSPEEQTAIATILSDMDNEIQTLEQRLSKTRQIKQGMMQELLTGKTRLPFGKDITSEVSV